MTRKIIASILLYSIHCQILHLINQQHRQQIATACWVMDTNNLTQIGMGNCISEIYFMKLGVGTPPQQLNFQIDTLRDLIWSPLDHGYSYNQSQTFQITDKKLVTLYHEELVQANLGSQIISIQNTNILTRSQIAWTQTIDLPFEPFINGLLGLGYSNTPNFLDDAYQLGQISSPVFALQMKSVHHESMIYYNDIPQWIQDQTIYEPIIGEVSWKIELKSIKIGNKDYSFISSHKMILDTSSSLFYLNPLMYNKIVQEYFKNCVKKGPKLICSCATDFPTFTLVLSAMTLQVQPANYVKPLDDNTQCMVMIGQTKYENGSILIGSVLMTNYVVTFDKAQNRIGFNGQKISVWQTIFYVCEFSMIGLSALLLTFGLYSLWDIRVKKKTKQEKAKCKLKNSKKDKKYQKPQIAMTFLEY